MGLDFILDTGPEGTPPTAAVALILSWVAAAFVALAVLAAVFYKDEAKGKAASLEHDIEAGLEETARRTAGAAAAWGTGKVLPRTVTYGTPLLFPRKEDKFARFQRWSRVSRHRVPPARPPVKGGHVELNWKIALDIFSNAQERVDPAAVPHAAPIPSLFPWLPGSTDRCSGGLSVVPPLEDGATALSSLGPEQVKSSGKVRDSEQVKDKILNFLIDAGPPKLLCSIPEEKTPTRLARELRDRCPILSCTTCLTKPSTPSTPESCKEVQSPVNRLGALLMDGDEVLRVGATGKPITRELLWAALAKIQSESHNRMAS